MADVFHSYPIRYGRVVEYNGREIKGPEYEILCLMVSELGMNDDAEAAPAHAAPPQNHSPGNRGVTLERLFNLREGLDGTSDRLPGRFTREPLSGDYKRLVPLKRILPKYYKLRGWDKNGLSKTRPLKKLGPAPAMRA